MLGKVINQNPGHEQQGQAVQGHSCSFEQHSGLEVVR
jgi:hypothetical protein